MSIKILDISDIEYHKNGKVSDFSGIEHGVLDKELVCLYWDGRHVKRIIVPVGFETDFGSIPKMFHWLVKPVGKSERGYVVHDWLSVADMKDDRKKADIIMREALIYCGVAKWEAWLAYSAVRLFNPLYEKFFRKKRNRNDLLISLNSKLIDKFFA